MEIQSSFVCAYCFQVNETIVDGTGNLQLEYVEDCQVCCRPNNLLITIAADRRSASVNADLL